MKYLSFLVIACCKGFAYCSCNKTSILAQSFGYGLIKNHPFVDGNKRIGTHAMLVFLAVNHMELQYEDADLIGLILGIAAGDYDVAYLLTWLQEHIE